MKKTNNSGISMITLIVTVVVLIILAGIAFTRSTDSIDSAVKAKIKVELDTYKDELRNYKMTKIAENPSFQDDSLYATNEALLYNTNKSLSTDGNIKDVIPSISDKYFNELSIIHGDLAITTDDENILAIMKENGILSNPYTISDGVLVSVAGNNDLIDETGALTIPPMINSLGQGSFANVEGLTTVIIPGTCKKVDDNAFANNSSLEKVIIEYGVERIGNNAFRSCSKLKEVDMADSVTSIGSFSFSENASLEKIKISSSLTSIGTYAIYSCRNLKEVTVPEGITAIPSSMFSNDGSLEKVTLPRTLTTINASAFASCGKLNTINFPKNLTTIAASAFDGCKSLTNINIDPTNTNFAFKDGILLGNSKTEMTIILPSAVSGNVFKVPEGVKKLNSNQLGGYTNITTVEIPASVTSLATTFLNPNIKNVIIDENNKNYTSDGSFVYSKDGKTIIKYYGTASSVTIKEGVESIPQYAFQNKSTITSLTLPSTLKSIGSQAFSGCTKLTSLTIGANVTDLNGLFIYSSAIENITISESNTKYKMINGALYSKDGKTFILPVKQLGSITSYEIPEGVTEIGTYAFHNQYNMTSIKLPSTLTKIGSSFNYCSKLPSIEIPSSVTSIHSSCFANCGAKLQQIIIHKPAGSISGAPWGSIYSQDRVVVWDN